MAGDAVTAGVADGLTGVVITGMRCGVMLLCLGVGRARGGLEAGFAGELLAVRDGNGVPSVKRGSGAAPVLPERIVTVIPVTAASASATTAMRIGLRSWSGRRRTTLT
jgi:hypothetical protein